MGTARDCGVHQHPQPHALPWQLPALGHRPAVQDVAVGVSLGSSAPGDRITAAFRAAAGCWVCRLPAQPCGHDRGLGNLVPTSSTKKAFPASLERSHECARSLAACTHTHSHTCTHAASPSLGRGPAAPWAPPRPGVSPSRAPTDPSPSPLRGRAGSCQHKDEKRHREQRGRLPPAPCRGIRVLPRQSIAGAAWWAAGGNASSWLRERRRCLLLSAGASAAFLLQMPGLCWGLGTPVGCGNRLISRNRVFISLLRKIDSFQNLKKKNRRV